MNQDVQQEKKAEQPGFFRQVTNWKELRFYQKTEVLYQLTYVFCERFLPKYGDRTVEQLAAAQKEAAQWEAAYENLKQRAVKAYRLQQEEIRILKKRLGEE